VIGVGSFTRDQAWSYLLAFLAWLAGWILVIFRYGGHQVVTTPAQRVGLIAMFGACAVMTRSAWTLTRSSEGPLIPRSPLLGRFIALFTLRSWLLMLGAGIPEAIRAIRSR
jgi:hypothetical protein